jgi:hypothetical protein
MTRIVQTRSLFCKKSFYLLFNFLYFLLSRMALVSVFFLLSDLSIFQNGSITATQKQGAGWGMVVMVAVAIALVLFLRLPEFCTCIFDPKGKKFQLSKSHVRVKSTVIAPDQAISNDQVSTVDTSNAVVSVPVISDGDPDGNIRFGEMPTPSPSVPVGSVETEERSLKAHKQELGEISPSPTQQ